MTKNKARFEKVKVSKGANQIVVNPLVLAKALSVLFNYRPLKGMAMNFRLLFLFIAVGFQPTGIELFYKGFSQNTAGFII